MPNTLLNCIQWNASTRWSTLDGVPHVLQLYGNTNFTNTLYKLIFIFCSIWFLGHTDSILFIATVTSCFLLLMSSLSPNNESTFFTCLHSCSSFCSFLYILFYLYSQDKTFLFRILLTHVISLCLIILIKSTSSAYAISDGMFSSAFPSCLIYLKAASNYMMNSNGPNYLPVEFWPSKEKAFPL